MYLKRARPRRHVLGESSYAQRELREVGGRELPAERQEVQEEVQEVMTTVCRLL